MTNKMTAKKISLMIEKFRGENGMIFSRKNRIIILSCIIIVLLIIITIFQSNTRREDMKQEETIINGKEIFTDTLKNNVTKIVCPTKMQNSITTNQDTIDTFFTLLQSMNFKPMDDNEEMRMGYYILEIDSGDRVIYLGINGAEVVINKVDYEVDKDISKEVYKLFFKE